MSAPGKEIEAFVCPEHGLMVPAPTNSGLDPWLGAWWICERGDRPGVSHRSVLIPSQGLEDLWAEQQRERPSVKPEQMTIPLTEPGLTEKNTEKETNR